MWHIRLLSNVKRKESNNTCKMLGDTSRKSSSYKNKGKKKSYKHTSGKQWLLRLTERLHGTINTLCM
jgi:uncharacterized protein YxeA